jgi:hypothetical protein
MNRILKVFRKNWTKNNINPFFHQTNNKSQNKWELVMRIVHLIRKKKIYKIFLKKY